MPSHHATPASSSSWSAEFSLKRIAVPAFGPSLLFGVGEGAILPIIPLMARDLGASVPVAALVIGLISIGSLLNNIPASLITARWGERQAILAAGLWSAIASTLRNHRRVFLTLGVGVLLVSAVRASRQVMIPLWADHIALAPAVASLLYGLAGGIDMLVFYPAGKVMDHTGRQWVAVPSMLVMGVAMVLMPLTSGFTTLLLASLAIGFGNGIGSGLIMTLGADHSPRHGRAHFLGVWRLMSDIGGSFGPALLSFLAGVLTLGAGIAATGLMAFSAAGGLAYWIPPHRRPSTDAAIAGTDKPGH